MCDGPMCIWNSADAIAFSWQHHVRVNSACPDQYLSLTMFYNANSEVQSRNDPSLGSTYVIDIVRWFAVMNDEISFENPLIDRNDPVSSDSQGSHQLLSNGNTLLWYRQVPKIKELTSIGKVVYTAEFGNLDSTISFRTFKLDDWHAVPSYPPQVTAEWAFKDPTSDIFADHSSAINVWMSWNGATDIDAYNVWIKLLLDLTLTQMAMVEKTGFETNVMTEWKS